MRDKIECARMVFRDFVASYEEHLGTDGFWTLGTDYEDDAAGLTSKEWLIGVAILTDKGLTEKEYENAWTLTEDGREVCAHPELLDDYLAPRNPARAGAASVAIHGGHFQFGDGNTQNISYRAVLQEALAVAEESDDVPAPIAGALRRLAEFPDLEELLSTAAAKIGDRT